MTRSQPSILAKIQSILPFGTTQCAAISNETVLAELGVTSMHLISMILALQAEYSLDIERLTECGMPTTVGQLISLVEERESAPRGAPR
jgi:acyl carrier protein